MGIELMDTLWAKAALMVGYFTTIANSLVSLLSVIEILISDKLSVCENLDTILDNLDAIQVYITAEDYVNAASLVTTTQGVVETVQGTLEEMDITSISSDIVTAQAAVTGGVGIVNELTPLITAEVERVYKNDGKVYNYKCTNCSIQCPKPLKFIPLDLDVLKICELKGDTSADFVQVSIEGEE